MGKWQTENQCEEETGFTQQSTKTRYQISDTSLIPDKMYDREDTGRWRIKCWQNIEKKKKTQKTSQDVNYQGGLVTVPHVVLKQSDERTQCSECSKEHLRSETSFAISNTQTFLTYQTVLFRYSVLVSNSRLLFYTGKLLNTEELSHATKRLAKCC